MSDSELPLSEDLMITAASHNELAELIGDVTNAPADELVAAALRCYAASLYAYRLPRREPRSPLAACTDSIRLLVQSGQVTASVAAEQYYASSEVDNAIEKMVAPAVLESARARVLQRAFEVAPEIGDVVCDLICLTEARCTASVAARDRYSARAANWFRLGAITFNECWAHMAYSFAAVIAPTVYQSTGLRLHGWRPGYGYIWANRHVPIGKREGFDVIRCVGTCGACPSLGWVLTKAIRQTVADEKPEEPLKSFLLDQDGQCIFLQEDAHRVRAAAIAHWPGDRPDGASEKASLEMRKRLTGCAEQMTDEIFNIFEEETLVHELGHHREDQRIAQYLQEKLTPQRGVQWYDHLHELWAETHVVDAVASVKDSPQWWAAVARKAAILGSSVIERDVTDAHWLSDLLALVAMLREQHSPERMREDIAMFCSRLADNTCTESFMPWLLNLAEQRVDEAKSLIELWLNR